MIKASKKSMEFHLNLNLSHHYSFLLASCCRMMHTKSREIHWKREKDGVCLLDRSSSSSFFFLSFCARDCAFYCPLHFASLTQNHHRLESQSFYETRYSSNARSKTLWIGGALSHYLPKQRTSSYCSSMFTNSEGFLVKKSLLRPPPSSFLPSLLSYLQLWHRRSAEEEEQQHPLVYVDLFDRRLSLPLSRQKDSRKNYGKGQDGENKPFHNKFTLY